MTKQSFGKEAWVEMFRTIGLDDAAMLRWHTEFEKQWPEAHDGFLTWLGLPAEDIAQIRQRSRATSAQP